MKKILIMLLVAMAFCSFKVSAAQSQPACRIKEIAKPYVGVSTHFNHHKIDKRVDKSFVDRVSSETLFAGISLYKRIHLESGITAFNRNKARVIHVDALFAVPLSEYISVLVGPGIGKMSHFKGSLKSVGGRTHKAHGLRLHAAAHYRLSEKLNLRFNLHTQKGTNAMKRVKACGIGLVFGL
jgi:hypothetical protein